jgi:phosphate transport system permease protein
VSTSSPGSGVETPLFDPAAPLTAGRNLRRRMVVSGLFRLAATAAALLAVAVLAIVVISVAQHAAGTLTFSFITTNANIFGGGGIASAIVGTVLIVAVAALIATPIGVLTGLYLTEFTGPRSPVARALKLTLDLMQGLPTVIVGVTVYGLIVARWGESGLAGSVAIAIVMLPLIARASQEVLLLVPGTLREAADSLGVARWRTVIGVILPSAISGIVTGVILAVARGAGETAPLLFTDHLFTNATSVNLTKPIPNISVSIYEGVQQASPAAYARAWGAAFVLLAVLLAANIGARVILARSRTRMTR